MYSMLYFAIAVCCQFVWLPPTLGIIGVMSAWFFTFNFKEKWQRLKSNPLLILMLLLYGVTLLGMLYSDNQSEGWKIVTVKIALFLFPLSIGTYPPIEKRKINRVLLTFAYTVLITSAILLLRASWYYFQEGEISYFFYHNLVFFNMVPVHYFAMYTCFAFFILLDKLFCEWSESSNGKKTGLIIALIILSGMLLLYSVRIQLVTFFIISSVFLVWQLSQRVNKKQVVLYLGAFVILFSSAVYSIPGSRKRVKETFEEWEYYRGIDNGKQTNHRVYLWKYGTQVIKENFWLGTGTGDADDALYEKAKHSTAEFWNDYTPYTLASKKYNYHNTFLQYFAALGIVGFILLVLLFIRPGTYLFRNFQFIPFCFLLLCLISFMTESMLERQAGNLFFAFMYSILFVSGFYRKPKNVTSSGQ